ncbi:MAG: hypothetical protein IJ861_01690 [Clostridia bacterium]|nr:hypothetical protein [Clostridia bacterium]
MKKSNKILKMALVIIILIVIIAVIFIFFSVRARLWADQYGEFISSLKSEFSDMEYIHVYIETDSAFDLILVLIILLNCCGCSIIDKAKNEYDSFMSDIRNE